MVIIESVHARQILDSRGNLTIQVVLDTEDGVQGLGLVPSGTSASEAETWRHRDGDKSVCGGKGALNVVKAVNEVIASKVIDMNAADQYALDDLMIEFDGTPNKGKLGTNAILGVFLVVLHAFAEFTGLSLYRYIGGTNSHILSALNMNIMNGGAHANFVIDIREYVTSLYGFGTYSETLRAGVKVHHTLKNVLRKEGLNTGLGSEGGFALEIKSNEDSLKHTMDTIFAIGYEPGKQTGICLDAASSKSHNKKTSKYRLDSEERGSAYMLDYYENLINEYPIVSIEDPLSREGWEDQAAIAIRLGDRLQFVDDDPLAANPARLQKAIDLGAINSLLVKLDQIGSVTKTLDVTELAITNGYTSMASHHSDETPDITIFDLAAVKNTYQIKTGTPVRGKCITKYNRLLKIEEESGSTTQYAGYSAFKACKKYLAGRVEMPVKA